MAKYCQGCFLRTRTFCYITSVELWKSGHLWSIKDCYLSDLNGLTQISSVTPILRPLMPFRFLVQDPILGQLLHSLVLSLWGPLIWKSGLAFAFSKRTGLLFCRMTSVCVCLVFPDWIQMRHLWQECVGRDLRITHVREKVDMRRGSGVPEAGTCRDRAYLNPG